MVRKQGNLQNGSRVKSHQDPDVPTTLLSLQTSAPPQEAGIWRGRVGAVAMGRGCPLEPSTKGVWGRTLAWRAGTRSGSLQLSYQLSMGLWAGGQAQAL